MNAYEWNKIDLSALPLVKIYAGSDISIQNPPQKYSLKCFGGVVSSPSGSTAVSGKWVDGAVDVQTSTTSIAVRTDLVAAPGSGSGGAVTITKSFATPGVEGNYEFTVPGVAL